MAGKFSWAAFAAEILQLAPQIISDIAADKATFSDEDRTTAAAHATMQASSLAQQLDPADLDTANEATAVAGAIITALKTPAPA